MELKDYQGLIQKQINYYNKLWYIDKEELRSISYLAFVKANKKYNKDKSKFSTWLTMWIRSEIIRWIKQNDKYNKNSSLSGLMREDCYQDKRNDLLRSIEFKSLISSLSEEAKTVINVIFNTPMEFVEMFGKDNIMNRYRLTSFLRKTKLIYSNPVSIFKEIKTALREFAYK